jgi:hypothetical protein
MERPLGVPARTLKIYPNRDKFTDGSGQKKSSSGIATPKPDGDLVRERLKAAEAHAKGERR